VIPSHFPARQFSGLKSSLLSHGTYFLADEHAGISIPLEVGREKPSYGKAEIAGNLPAGML